MSLLNTVAGGTNALVAGSSALGLVSSTQALLGFTKSQVRGINNFLFDIPTGEEIILTSQITDHFVENNYAVQDHIAMEPLRLRLTGIVAELVYTKDEFEKYANDVLDRLGPLGVLNPAGSQSTREYLAQYNRTKQAIDQSINMVKKTGASLLGLTAENKQQTAFNTLYEWWNLRSTVLDHETVKYRLLTVETPWVTLKNMAIETVNFTQDESTKDLSTVEITLKQIRFVNVVSRQGTINGRAASGVGVKEKAVSQGKSGTVAYTFGEWLMQ